MEVFKLFSPRRFAMMEVFTILSQIRVDGGLGGGPHGFVPGQSSPSSGSGPQGFVPGQSSTALRGADDVDDQELIECTRREFSFSSGDEEEDEEDETAEEEETEQMDLEGQPSRFQGHFRPRRYCASILKGGLCWQGSSCTFAHSHDELHPDLQGQW